VLVRKCAEPHLDHVLVQSKSVDDTNVAGFLRQQSNLVRRVTPPRTTQLSDVVTPRQWWRDVQETAMWSVVFTNTSYWINMLTEL